MKKANTRTRVSADLREDLILLAFGQQRGQWHAGHARHFDLIDEGGEMTHQTQRQQRVLHAILAEAGRKTGGETETEATTSTSHEPNDAKIC